MKLQETLNKFVNTNFLLTIDGFCDDLPFSEYEVEKSKDYWKKYKNKKIKSMCILLVNGIPELSIKLEE